MTAREGSRTDAEIFKDVALQAIQATWRLKVAMIIMVTILMMFAVYSIWTDSQRMALMGEVNTTMQETQRIICDRNRWESFITQPQHIDVIKKSCMAHHSDQPSWWDDMRIPVPPELESAHEPKQ